MKRLLFLLTAFLLLALPSCAKKVTVTIDGTLSPTQTTLYLIINEDTAHAQRVPIQDAHIDWRDGTIEGSPMSKKLQEATREVARTSPEGFHVDVFTDDPEAWASARETERSIRARMLQDQIETIQRVIQENRKNNIPAWIVYCYYTKFDEPFRQMFDGYREKWTKHPILKLLKRE